MNAVECDNLAKSFGTRKALDSVSFALPEGSFLSVFGPNGAGKTTLLRALSTLVRPSSGDVRICGIDAKEDPDAVRACIGMVSHAPLLYPDLTAEENLLFYARLYGVANPKQRVDQLLDAVGLGHRKYDCVRAFSRGMAQRASIARAFVHSPRVVFLDEPYAGLDPHATAALDTLIASSRGTQTFAMVSHDLHKGLEMCTHVLMLARGRVVMFAPKSEIDTGEFADLYRKTLGAGVA